MTLSSNACLGAPGSSSQLLNPTWLCSDVQVHLQNLPLSLQMQQLLVGTLLLRLSSPLSSFDATTISLPSNRQHHSILFFHPLFPVQLLHLLVQGYPCLASHLPITSHLLSMMQTQKGLWKPTAQCRDNFKLWSFVHLRPEHL